MRRTSSNLLYPEAVPAATIASIVWLDAGLVGGACLGKDASVETISGSVDKASIRRVLIVRLGAIGDCLRVLPALARLRAGLPDAEIGWLVEHWVAPVLEGQPAIARLHVLDRRRLAAGPACALSEFRRMRSELHEARYDVAIDFHARLKSGIFTRASGAPLRIGFDRAAGAECNHLFTSCHVSTDDLWESRVLRNLRLVAPLGLSTGYDAEARGLRIDPGSAAWAAKWYRSNGAPAVAVFPGSSLHRRADRWPVERWQQALAALGDAGHASVVVWGPSEIEIASQIAAGAGPGCTLAPPTTLPQMMALLGHFRLYLGSNTAALHMAWMQDVPAVVLIGARPSRTDAPLPPVASVMLRAGPEPRAKLGGAAARRAMEQIAVGDVVRAAEQLLGGAQSPARQHFARPAPPH